MLLVLKINVSMRFPKTRSKIDELENIHNPTHTNVYLIHHMRIQEFSLGGVQVNLTKKYYNVFFFFFLVLILFCRSQMVNFKENYHFQSSGGGPTFSRGRGVQSLIHYRNPYNLWFSRGSGPPAPPPSGSALDHGPSGVMTLV